MYEKPRFWASSWAWVSSDLACSLNRSNGYVRDARPAWRMARRMVDHLGGDGRVTARGAKPPGSGVWRSIHSRQAATTMELTGMPVRADAWSRRWYISSVKRTVVALAM